MRIDQLTIRAAQELGNNACDSALDYPWAAASRLVRKLAQTKYTDTDDIPEVRLAALVAESLEEKWLTKPRLNRN